jgi:hypothetical protein
VDRHPHSNLTSNFVPLYKIQSTGSNSEPEKLWGQKFDFFLGLKSDCVNSSMMILIK